LYYRASCVSSDGGTTRGDVSVHSPILVTKVTGQASYTCTVRAVNLVGPGPSSSPSAPTATPAGLAGAPTGATVTPAGPKGAVYVSFSPPASDGGNAVDYFKVTCTSSTGGASRSSATTASPGIVTGLTAGSSYTCRVAADNSAGMGPVSPQSAPYTVSS
jgi:hypothetical protein